EVAFAVRTAALAPAGVTWGSLSEKLLTSHLSSVIIFDTSALAMCLPWLSKPTKFVARNPSKNLPSLFFHASKALFSRATSASVDGAADVVAVLELAVLAALAFAFATGLLSAAPPQAVIIVPAIVKSEIVNSLFI